MGLSGGNPIVSQGASVHNHCVYRSHENLIGSLFQDTQGRLQEEVIFKVASYLKIISSQCV